MRRGLVIALAVAASSCGDHRGSESGWPGTIDTVGGRVIVHNPPAGVWSAGGEWRIVEDLRIGALDGSGPEVFGRIAGIAVSSTGEIAVLDGQADEVRIFARDGSYVRTVGRSGRGPGELTSPLAVHYDAMDRLWVPDVGTARYNIFSADGEFLRSRPRFGFGIVKGHPGVFTAGGLLDPTPRLTRDGAIQTLFVRVDTTGAIADTLAPVVETHLTARANLPAGLLPFLPHIVEAAEPGGDIWLASTDAYTLYRRAPDGDTVLVVEVETEPGRLSAEHEDTIRAVIARWGRPVDRGAFDLGWQYIRSLHPDESGRLFIQPDLPGGTGGGTVFDVIDERGRYLGRIHTDIAFARRPPPLFRGGAVYGATLDDLGVPYVVRGRILMDARPE